MTKPKTKDIARRGIETTAQRVKMQMREVAGQNTTPESYGGDAVEDSTQYIAERAADEVRKIGSSVKDKAMEQIKERIEWVHQREDVPNAQEPNSGASAPQDRPVDATPDPTPDRSPRQKPEGAERIKSKDNYIHSQRKMLMPREPQNKVSQAERSSTSTKGNPPRYPRKSSGRSKANELYQSPCLCRKANGATRIQVCAAGREAYCENSREKCSKDDTQRDGQNSAKGRGQNLPHCRENRKQEREDGGTNSTSNGKGNPTGSPDCRQNVPGCGPYRAGSCKSFRCSSQGCCKSRRRIDQGIDRRCERTNFCYSRRRLGGCCDHPCRGFGGRDPLRLLWCVRLK